MHLFYVVLRTFKMTIPYDLYIYPVEYSCRLHDYISRHVTECYRKPDVD